MRMLRIAVAVSLSLTGYLHADLYLHGYRSIATIGPSFLLLASGCFAIAALLLVGVVTPEPPLLRLAAAGLAGGALIGFALSRTVGLFGFTERGLQPAPQALLSLFAETTALVLTMASFAVQRRGRPSAGRTSAGR
jgi:hypothetical protein